MNNATAKSRFFCIGVVGHNVTIVTYPAGIPVDDEPNTYDYPILTSVTLMCMVTPVNGSLVNVTSYLWTAVDCYNNSYGVDDPCFYDGGKTGQNITGIDILAQDAGTVICTATIDDTDYISDALTLRISGKLCSYFILCV